MRGVSVLSGQHHADAPRNGGARAHALFTRDVDYIVKDGEVTSLTNTPVVPCRAVAGPMVCPGCGSERRCADPERKPNAGLITFQNYFRLYEKLAGMTGTVIPKLSNLAQSTSWIPSLFRQPSNDS